MNTGTVHLEALCLFVIFIKLEGFVQNVQCSREIDTRPVFGVKRGGSSKAGIVFNQLDDGRDRMGWEGR